MPYQISHDLWIQVQVSRVRGVLTQNMDPERVYTLPDLLALCTAFGLEYSVPTYQEIGAALIAEGFLVGV